MKRAIISLIFITLAISVFCQATFTVTAPGRVSVGEKFAVTFRLRNGEGTSLKAPQINGCTQLFGPAVSSSRSFSMVNGQTSSSSMYDYTFTYRADKEGTYTIGEASIMVNGKRMTTRPQKLTIVAGAAAASSGSRQQQRGGVSIDDITTQSADKGVSNSDVFVRIIMSKPTAYEQEAVECTIKLYTKYSISSFFPTKQPSFDGFLIQELDVQPALNQVEVFNGQRYMTALLKKCIMYPQKSGRLTINSGNYDIDVVQYDQVNMGLFTVQSPKERKIKVSSNSASINIKALPFPQPEGFFGAVGKFDVKSRLVGNVFKTNEPATLIYDISGTGNIKYIREPEIDFPSEFEKYTPKKQENISATGNNLTGTVSIEYTFVPQQVGEFKIGGNKFVYFNPDTKQYVTINTPSYNLKVSQGSTVKSNDKEDVKQKNTDIKNIIVNDRASYGSQSSIISSIWYWTVIALMLGAFIATAAVNKKRIIRRADVKGMRIAKASKVAKKRLKQASVYLKLNESDKFYEEVLKAMWGYLSDKLSMPSSQLNRDNIIVELEGHGIDTGTSDMTIKILY